MTKQAWLRLPVFIMLWILFIAIKLPVWILGWVVIPLMWGYRYTLYRNLPWWTRPWANPEDWLGGPQSYKNSLPKWWVDKHGGGFWSFYRYHAGRNGANGLRSFEFLDLDIEMSEVKYVTNSLQTFYEPWHIRKLSEDFVNGFRVPRPRTVWYWCWQGWKAGFKYVHLWQDLKPHWWTDWRWWVFSGPKSGPRHFVAKFGWRVEPRDATVPIDPEGTRVDDAGFASKALPYRKG